MTGTVEALHNKFIGKLNILENISDYIKSAIIAFENSNHYERYNDVPASKPKFMSYAKYMDLTIKADNSNLQQIDKLIVEIASIRAIYNAGTSPILSAYYGSATTDRDLHEEYITLVMSENISDQMDRCLAEMDGMVKSYQKNRNFRKFVKEVSIATNEPYDDCELNNISKLLTDMAGIDEVSSTNFEDFFLTVQRQKDQYEQSKLHMPMEREQMNKCADCGHTMTIFQDMSELRCDNEECGVIITLDGTVFEDSQFYTQQGQVTKHKKYDARRHCKKWLDQIQAKENRTFPEHVISELNKSAKKYYTRNGRLRRMVGMKCARIRIWLKDIGETDYNPHAPLLRKIITSENGKAIIPPQLNYEEEQRILGLFSRAMDIYEQLMEEKKSSNVKKSKTNKPYYPYVLFKILCIVLRRGSRLRGLIECIHLQSDSTLKNHDIIWKKICSKMTDEKDFVYRPTDRTMLIDIF